MQVQQQQQQQWWLSKLAWLNVIYPHLWNVYSLRSSWWKGGEHLSWYFRETTNKVVPLSDTIFSAALRPVQSYLLPLDSVCLLVRIKWIRKSIFNLQCLLPQFSEKKQTEKINKFQNKMLIYLWVRFDSGENGESNKKLKWKKLLPADG